MKELLPLPFSAECNAIYSKISLLPLTSILNIIVFNICSTYLLISDFSLGSLLRNLLPPFSLLKFSILIFRTLCEFFLPLLNCGLFNFSLGGSILLCLLFFLLRFCSNQWFDNWSRQCYFALVLFRCLNYLLNRRFIQVLACCLFQWVNTTYYHFYL